MTTLTPHSLPALAPHPRAAFWLAVNLTVGTVLLGLLALFLGMQAQLRPAIVAASLFFGSGLLGTTSAVLMRRASFTWGAALLIARTLILILGLPFLFAGFGLLLAAVGLVETAVTGTFALSRRRARRVTLLGVVGALAAVLLDQWLSLPILDVERLTPPPDILALVPVLAGAIILAYSFFIVRRFSNYSLRTKLILTFLAVALVPLSILAYVSERATREALTNSANLALASAATQTATQLDEFFQNVQVSLRAETQLPALKAFLALPPELRPGTSREREVASLLEILKDKDSRVAAYMLLDSRGHVAATTATLDRGQNKSGLDYFRVPFTTAQPYISPVSFYDRATSGSIYFSYQVRDAAFNPIGVLVARYDAVQILQDFIVTVNDQAGAGSFAVVFDEYQLHLAHGTEPATLFKFVGPTAPSVIDTLRAANRLPEALLAAASTPDDLTTRLPGLQRRLLGAAQQPSFVAEDVATGDELNQVYVTQMKTLPWRVAFFQPRSVFLAPAEAQTRANVVLAVLMAGLMSAAALGVAQLLGGPILRLTAVTERVTQGDLTTQAKVESGDETGALAIAFNHMTSRLRDLIESLEQRVERRTAQLQAAADISRATASVRDVDQLLKLALTLIRERFGFYHASVFLLDEAAEFAVVRESTGPVGAQLKARGHRLAVGSHSLIGWVTEHRRPRVALDVAEDPFHFKNPLLPDTRSELAIPLLVGDRLLGALDVQSTQPNAFTESDVQVMQTLADQLSVAIENAEFFQQAQARLAEMSALYQQMTGSGWRSLVRGQPSEVIYEIEPQTGDLRPPSTLEISTAIAVPLELRGQVVGTIELHGRRSGGLNAEERAVLDTISAQLSVALESAALLEETQRRSRRERLINEISYRMRSDLNPTAILQSGIRELGQALGATEVVVRLAPPPGRPATGRLVPPDNKEG